MDLGKEIAAAGEGFQIKELVFFQPMHCFDVALVGVSGGRDAHVLAVNEGGRKVAFEFTAIVGLPDQVTQRDAIASQMLLDARSEDSAGRGTAPLGEGPEQQAAANFASGVLNQG